MHSAAPNRPNCVDDESSRQTIAAGNLRFTRSATAEHAAFGTQFRACAAMDCAVHSSAAEKRCISGVHNAVNLEFRDITA
jgi:hypothetical protein